MGIILIASVNGGKVAGMLLQPLPQVVTTPSIWVPPYQVQTDYFGTEVVWKKTLSLGASRVCCLTILGTLQP